MELNRAEMTDRAQTFPSEGQSESMRDGDQEVWVLDLAIVSIPTTAGVS